MVRYRRHRLAGGTCFFTVALADRTSDALTANIALLRAAFRRARAERPFALDAIVVLPDHLHAVMTLPPYDADFPMRWQRIKTLFTQGLDTASLNRRDRSGRVLWQRRYWEHDPGPRRLLAPRRLHPLQPGQARLRPQPADWPYSSLHRYIRHGVLPPDWAADCEDDGGQFGERRAATDGQGRPS